MDTPHRLRTGIIGPGFISGIYLKNLTGRFGNVEVVAVAGRDAARTQERAREFGVPRACTVDELLADPSVELAVDLTVPNAHFSVGRSVLEAGKHLYAEKPLATTLPEGELLVELARTKGLRLGSAPDTVLGAGLQTCRKLIDEGAIGTPVGGSAFMLGGGHEGWHPDPAFYYRPGGGPLFDMGPYYLSALVALLGPVDRLAGSAKKGFSSRTITSEPRRGQAIAVEVPTHLSALLEFAGGASVSITTSFDVRGGTTHVPLEIYGTEGTLLVPDPNTFGGPVRLRRAGETQWTDVPLISRYPENSRGLGVSDLAANLAAGTPHRASGDLALHVLEIMHGVDESARTGSVYRVRHTCARPEPM